VTEEDTMQSLSDKIDRAEQGKLQAWFDLMVKTLPHLPMPDTVLVASDFHAGDGGLTEEIKVAGRVIKTIVHIDPLKNSGMEPAILDLLDSHQDFTWVLHEVWDIWRGYTWPAVTAAHPELSARMVWQASRGSHNIFYQLDSNHGKDALTLPPAVIFEGYGKKFFFFHGHQFDWPNDQGWKIGREAVRMADELGLDPMTSPHVTSADRHAAVREMWLNLADANKDWEIFTGHSHFFEQRGYYNSGSPITGRLTYYEIINGEIIPKGA
jgi:hypothetical protein